MSLSSLAQRSPLASKRHSFLTGLIQMFLMSINIKNMANGHLIWLAGFTLINTHVWLYMVRTAIHSTRWERFIYGVGSAAGAVLGVVIHYYYIKPHALTQLAAVTGL
jgi:hypothetical protein